MKIAIFERIPYNTSLDAPFTRCDLCDVSEYQPISDAIGTDGPVPDFLPMYRAELDGETVTICENCKNADSPTE